MRELTTLRAYGPNDKNFIYSTWLKGQFYGTDFFKQVPHDIFYASYPSLIDSLLSRPETTITVLCLTDDPDTIIGYAVYTHPEALHWVFIKQPWRGQGFAKQMLPQGIKSFSGKTAPGDVIAKKYKWTFKPLVLTFNKGDINV